MMQAVMISNEFISSINTPEYFPNPSYWLIFQGSKVLVLQDENGRYALPQLNDVADLELPLLRQHYLGHFSEGDVHCFCGEIATDTAVPDIMGVHGLRGLYGRIPEEHFWLAGRAIQIIDWDRNHVYCSRCRAENEIQEHERSKKCPECDLVTYPRISPAIIVRVTRETANGSEILLARGPRHPAGFYSVLAGFVEPGETLEMCVQREVKEEVGIDVQDIRYFGSQPWPFPNSLMIGFTAVYANGDLELEEEEIEDAQWYTPDNLPNIPPPLSISNALITDWVKTANRQQETENN